MAGNFIIAGGSKGIGLDLVHRLRPKANQIKVLSRHMDDLAEVENVQHHAVDFLADELPELDLPDEIHGVVYCPGSINLKSFRSLKVEDFKNDFEINVLGAIKFLKSCLSGLKKGASEHPASVVMFSTVAVQQGMSMHASIAAAKGAIEALTRSLAAELAPQVRVNCIAPALTETPLASRFFKNEDSRRAMAEKYPLGRTGMPQDIASMAEFLLMPESSWITGQVFGVDGGLSTAAGG